MGNLETLQKVWELAKKNLTTDETTNKFLLGTDNKEEAALHWAAYGG